MTSETTEPKTERVPFMAPRALVDSLDAAAKECGITRSELIRRRLDADPFIYAKARAWQGRQADVAEQRADSSPVPVVGAAYGPEPQAPLAFAGIPVRAEAPAMVQHSWVSDYERDHAAELAIERDAARRSAGIIGLGISSF